VHARRGAYSAGCAAGRKTLLKDKAAAELSVMSLDQGHALPAEQALVQARDSRRVTARSAAACSWSTASRPAEQPAW
jgi:hypothetical protein